MANRTPSAWMISLAIFLAQGQIMFFVWVTLTEHKWVILAERRGPGEIVCVKGGYIFTRATLDKVAPILGPAEIQIADDLFIGPIHADEREGCVIFSNHSCDPNIGVQGQIVFVALRQISAGEELTHDWATTDDDDYALACRCGAARYRGTITGKDWQREDLQRKYRGLFSWFLQQKIAVLEASKQ